MRSLILKMVVPQHGRGPCGACAQNRKPLILNPLVGSWMLPARGAGFRAAGVGSRDLGVLGWIWGFRV